MTHVVLCHQHDLYNSVQESEAVRVLVPMPEPIRSRLFPSRAVRVLRLVEETCALHPSCCCDKHLEST
jgi:hypothetical protein